MFAQLAPADDLDVQHHLKITVSSIQNENEVEQHANIKLNSIQIQRHVAIRGKLE